MRRLILKVSMSIDGFIAGPNDDNEWMVKSRSPDGAAWVLDAMQGAGAHVLGRKIYESWATFWPSAGGPFATLMNEMPRIVFTRQQSFSSLPSWPAEINNGDLATEITRLKQQDGNHILAQGGVDFVQSLVQLGLIDEYRLAIHPVALGAGHTLFAKLPAPVDLQLVSSTSFSTGAMGNIYRPA